MSRAGLTKTSTLGAWPWQKRGLHGSPKKYPDELVERGVRLALESERPIAQIAADLGMHPRRREARELRAAPDVCEWDYGRLALRRWSRPGRHSAAARPRSAHGGSISGPYASTYQGVGAFDFSKIFPKRVGWNPLHT
jgi:hypothetical protein